MSRKYASGNVKRKLKADRENFEKKLPKLSNFFPSTSTADDAPPITKKSSVGAVDLSESEVLNRDEDVSNGSERNKETNDMTVQSRLHCSNLLEDSTKSVLVLLIFLKVKC
ncbi:hypothetical protein TSAR_013330 [Trichomalopsis sarcophagae]|uniref:Uncharacterized protein n=1 Tax=Trichomalopsis sarcophagae TaxID=543379 RepID=A0A232EQV7_9HYME|nr:hypothetical protein TSAR_013330 [Trichomalopsis sarcophagae]